MVMGFILRNKVITKALLINSQNKEEVFNISKMEIFTKEIIKMAYNMAMESTIVKTELFIRVIS
jgi:hypothetical protein